MSKNRDFSKLGNYITADANGNLTITGASAGYGNILSSIDGGSGVSYTNYVNTFSAQNTSTNSGAVTGLAFNVGVSGDVLGFEITSNGTRTGSASAVTKAFSSRSSAHIYVVNGSTASTYSDIILGSAAVGSTSVTRLLSINGLNGNVVLKGATGQAWSTTQFNAIEIGAGYSYFTGRVDLLNGLWMGTNAYYNGTNWKYVNSSYASQYVTNDGAHKFQYAASGTAGNNITWNDSLVISSTGTVTIPNQVCFKAYINTGNPTASKGGGAVVPYDAVVYNQGGNPFNITTHRFTAPIAGKYLFNVVLNAYNNDSAASWLIRLNKNGSLYTNLLAMVLPVGNTGDTIVNNSCIMDLAVNDYVEVIFSNSGSGTFTYSSGIAYNTFTGQLLS